MGRVDAVVFTGGIGENNPYVVKNAVKGLNSMLKNPFKVLVVPTNEELMIAKLSYNLCRKKK